MTSASHPEKSNTKSKTWLWWCLGIAGLGIVIFFLGPKITRSVGASNAAKASGKDNGGKAPPATPVVAVQARKGNIGVYDNGLGAVTPIYTVTVKSRVDGQLMSVNYREGDTVHQGDLLIEIDPRPYQAQLLQAQGQLIKDQANLANARIDVARYETLVKQNAVPEQQLATQIATVTQDEGTVKSDQAQIDTANLNVTYSKITAPITGRVGLRLVDPGNIVHATDTNGLLVITQMQPISVIFTISEDQLPVVMQKTRAGQKLTVDAYDRDMKRKLSEGSLTTIDNQIDQSTGTVRLRATFDNKDEGLFPNQFVNARLLVEEKRGVVMVASAAIQRTSTTAFVYLVKPDSTVTVRNVQVGTTEGDDSEITSGLQPGDTVVLTGADRLEEGSHVNAQVQASASANQSSGQPAAAKPAKGKQP